MEVWGDLQITPGVVWGCVGDANTGLRPPRNGLHFPRLGLASPSLLYPLQPLTRTGKGTPGYLPNPSDIGPLGAHCHRGHSPASRQDSCALCIRTWPGSWEDVSPIPGPRDVRSAPQRAGVGRGRPGVGGSPISTLRPWHLVKPLDPFSGGICKLIT